VANVLITGCSSGFGELAALTFAQRGHRVVATMRRVGSSAAITARGDIHQVTLDVTDPGSVSAGVDAAVDHLDGLDIVVNNAGIEVFGAVHLLSDDEVFRQFDTNVTGVVRVVRATVPYLLASGGGTIVNVGSVAGTVGAPYGGIYAASKHALEGLSEAMHFELSNRGIRVRIVEPGQFATALGSNATVAAAMPEGSADHDRWQRFRTAQRSLVNGEPADPQVVADVIYAAATEVPGRFRYPVGTDAELVIGTKAAMTFEDFDTTMRAALDWHE
jgi:NAD(P)-dependent dehydrogenase (short-subunit alcohol dehydrogenase family)